jgi:UrcA family protein
MNSTPISERSAARFACIALLALSAGTLATTAGAEPTLPEPPQVTVSYADLELSRTAGIAKLYRRIARAAAQVCERTNGKVPQNAARAKTCATHAIADAVARVDSPGLLKYYASITGKVGTEQTAAAMQR